MESRFEGEPMRPGTQRRLLVVVWFAMLPAAGCVSTQLEAPANHPGHPSAHTGKLTLSSALHPVHDIQEEAVANSPTTEDGSGATYVCPMHPEIVRKEPGNCPICGMKLVPKKSEK
jgi:hypothetical protein